MAIYRHGRKEFAAMAEKNKPVDSCHCTHRLDCLVSLGFGYQVMSLKPIIIITRIRLMPLHLILLAPVYVTKPDSSEEQAHATGPVPHPQSSCH